MMQNGMPKPMMNLAPMYMPAMTVSMTSERLFRFLPYH